MGLIGLTAVLGSQAAPTIAPYAKELFYQILLAIVERLFRSAESLATKYLRLDAEANALASSKAPSSADSEGMKKPKTVEMLEGRTAASQQSAAIVRLIQLRKKISGRLASMPFRFFPPDVFEKRSEGLETSLAGEQKRSDECLRVL